MTLTATERYKQQLEQREKEIVTVKCAPSGFPYQFEKPSKIALMFGKNLPSTITGAVAMGLPGVDVPKEFGALSREKQVEILDAGLRNCDRLLKLSHDPKLVMGEAKADNELSVFDVAEDDLDYLYQWISAGGDEAIALAIFRKMRGLTGNSVNGKGRENKSK